MKGTNECCALSTSDTLVLISISSSNSHRRFEEVNWPLY